MKQYNNDNETKKRILSAAVKIFAQKGYDGAGIREICRDAKINISMISYYFGGKQELYEAIIADVIAAQLEYLDGKIDLFADYDDCSTEECRAMIYNFTDLMIDFFYDVISFDQMKFFIREQHSENFAAVNPPAKLFMRKVLLKIFDGVLTDTQVSCLTALIAAQITAPRILPLINGNRNFTSEDVIFIKNNMRRYLRGIFSEI